jgi:lipase
MAILNTEEWGSPGGTPVLCLHGVTGHAGRYRRLAERLPGRRVVGIDLRGHGRSTWSAPWGIDAHVADLVETAESLGVAGGAAWVGHSFGGRLVAELAAREPERVERAVLIDPALHVDPQVATERAALLRDTRLGDGSLFTTPRAFLEEEAEQHLERGDEGRYRWRYSPTAVIVAWSEMSTEQPPWPSCPTLVVVGVQSWIPVRVPRLANLQSLPVPGGHSVLWDDFDATAAAVEEFLAR